MQATVAELPITMPVITVLLMETIPDGKTMTGEMIVAGDTTKIDATKAQHHVILTIGVLIAGAGTMDFTTVENV